MRNQDLPSLYMNICAQHEFTLDLGGQLLPFTQPECRGITVSHSVIAREGRQVICLPSILYLHTHSVLNSLQQPLFIALHPQSPRALKKTVLPSPISFCNTWSSFPWITPRLVKVKVALHAWKLADPWDRHPCGCMCRLASQQRTARVCTARLLVQDVSAVTPLPALPPGRIALEDMCHAICRYCAAFFKLLWRFCQNILRDFFIHWIKGT